MCKTYHKIVHKTILFIRFIENLYFVFVQYNSAFSVIKRLSISFKLICRPHERAPQMQDFSREITLIDDGIAQDADQLDTGITIPAGHTEADSPNP